VEENHERMDVLYDLLPAASRHLAEALAALYSIAEQRWSIVSCRGSRVAYTCSLYHVCRLFIQSFVFKMVLYRCRGKRTHYVLRLDIPRLRFNMESSQQIRI